MEKEARSQEESRKIMATAQQVIDRALTLIIVQGSEAPVEASEYQDAIFALNAMMLALDSRGVKLDYTEVSSLNQEVTVPPGAIQGVCANLAIELAPEYNATVTPALLKSARDGEDAMRFAGQRIGHTAYPSTLPRGTGNGYNSSGYWSRFYPGVGEDILSETTGAIGLETGTEDIVDGG